jgi:hypothetical protein
LHVVYRLSVHIRNAIDKLKKRFLWYESHVVKKKILFSLLKVMYLDLIHIELMNTIKLSLFETILHNKDPVDLGFNKILDFVNTIFF